MRRFRWSSVMMAAGFAIQGSAMTFGQATSGDLDGNHEVNLSDMTGFVGCLTGPDDPSNDPGCDAAFFDADNDVDLGDVAAFQNRFGFGVGPPRIDRFWPTPGTWIVDDVGLTHLEVGFSEPVIVRDGSINVWVVSRLQVDGGDVTGFTTNYDPDAFMLTITFAEPLRDDRVTVIVDYLIEDLAGNPLDGEICAPQKALLPSGNGNNGGQGVFRIHVLQGDVNRDGTVDAADLDLINASKGMCSNDPGFDPLADLNWDGCVNDQDATITAAVMGQQLPATDGAQPRIILIRSGYDQGIDWISVEFSETLAPFRFDPRSCFLVNSTGTVIPASFASLTAFGDKAEYFFIPGFDDCQNFSINASNVLSDLSGELTVAPAEQRCP